MPRSSTRIPSSGSDMRSLRLQHGPLAPPAFVAGRVDLQPFDERLAGAGTERRAPGAHVERTPVAMEYASGDRQAAVVDEQLPCAELRLRHHLREGQDRSAGNALRIERLLDLARRPARRPPLDF